MTIQEFSATALTFARTITQALRLMLARMAGLSPAELEAALAKRAELGGTAAPLSAPASNVHYLTPAGPRRTDMGLAEKDSVVPPNVERAVRTVMATSGRGRLGARELERFLTGLGLCGGDARSIVTRARMRAGRDQFGAEDLVGLQDLVTRSWLEQHARGPQSAHFLARLGEELGVQLDEHLDASTLAAARTRLVAALVRRGWSEHAASGMLTLAVERAATLVVQQAR